MAIVSALLTNQVLNDVSAQEGPLFLIIDEDTIDNGTSTIEQLSFIAPHCGGGNPAVCVNDDIAIDAGSGLTTPLFSRGTDVTPFTGLVLPTGQGVDQGLFRVGLSPSELDAFIRDTLPNSRLDPIPGVPLGEAEIRALKDKIVCAKVKDSDVSNLGGGRLNAQGAYMGLTAFLVTDVLDPGSIPGIRLQRQPARPESKPAPVLPGRSELPRRASTTPTSTTASTATTSSTAAATPTSSTATATTSAASSTAAATNCGPAHDTNRAADSATQHRRRSRNRACRILDIHSCGRSDAGHRRGNEPAHGEKIGSPYAAPGDHLGSTCELSGGT